MSACPRSSFPLPGARGDEQAFNAQVLGTSGAAVVIVQAEATPERLQREIWRCSTTPSDASGWRRRLAPSARPDAAAR